MSIKSVNVGPIDIEGLAENSQWKIIDLILIIGPIIPLIFDTGKTWVPPKGGAIIFELDYYSFKFC